VYNAPLFRSETGRTGKMPKLKTKRSAVKRFRMTGTGKIKAGRANKRHNLTLSKSRSRRHRCRIPRPAFRAVRRSNSPNPRMP